MSQNLLLVEDDQAFADVLLRRLQRQGYDCRHALDVGTGLELADSFHPQYVLLDMKVGEDNSLPAIPTLRQKLPNARIILLTGYASIATAVEAIKAGANDYLPKPVNTQALLTALAGGKVEELENEAMSLARMEWEHIQEVLNRNEGNVSATARELGLHRRTLQRKLFKRPALK